MSELRRGLLKLAHTNPELRDSLVPLLAKDRPRTAKGWGYSFMKNVQVGSGQIKKAAYSSRNSLITSEFLDSLDFGRIDYGKILQKWPPGNGPYVYFRVYPKGEYGMYEREPGTYLQGYVQTNWVIGSKGIEITGEVAIISDG